MIGRESFILERSLKKEKTPEQACSPSGQVVLGSGQWQEMREEAWVQNRVCVFKARVCLRWRMGIEALRLPAPQLGHRTQGKRSESTQLNKPEDPVGQREL